MVSAAEPLWVVVSAPSGAGKTTLVKRLLKRHPRFGFSLSVTTRARRAGERDWEDYHFVSIADFERLRRGRRLLEWAKIHGSYYGTPWAPLKVKRKSEVVFFDVNRQGALAIKKVCPEAVLVFILPPDRRALASRLSGRGTESSLERKKRLADARKEIAASRFYDYWIINHTVEESIKYLEAVVLAELSRTWRIKPGNKS
jgi:guanylate kinase